MEDDPFAHVKAQREAALAKGNAVKAANSAVRKLIKQRQVKMYPLINGDADDEVSVAVAQQIQEWTLDRLLRAIPNVGPTRRQDIMEVFGLSPRTKFKALSWEQRKQFATLIRASVQAWY